MFAGILYVDLGTFVKDMTKNIQVDCLLGKCWDSVYSSGKINKITLYCHIFNYSSVWNWGDVKKYIYAITIYYYVIDCWFMYFIYLSLKDTF